MCGSLDLLTEALEDLEKETGADRGAGSSDYGWLFRWDLDRLGETVINLLSSRQSAAECEVTAALYDCVMSARLKVRISDRELLAKLAASVDAAASPLEA